MTAYAMNPTQQQQVKNFVAQLEARLGLQSGIFQNEEVRDGTRVALVHPDGWYLKIMGGLTHRSLYGPSELGVEIDGLIENPRSEFVEYMTLYGAPPARVRKTYRLDDKVNDIVDEVCSTVVPFIAEYGEKIRTRWAREAAIKAARQAARERFEMEPGQNSKTIQLPLGGHAEVTVWEHQSDPDRMSTSLKLQGLSVDETEAVLALLQARRAN